MDFKNYMHYIALMVFFGVVCSGSAQSMSAEKKDFGVKKGLFPYLKDRKSFAFGNNSSNSRLKNLAWHPTDLVFALSGGTAGTEPELSVHGISGKGSRAVIEKKASVVIGNPGVINSVSWHPSGLYLAAGVAAKTPQLRVYSYSGKDLTSFTSLERGGDVQVVAWHPGGRFLAVGGVSSTTGYHVEIYAFSTITPALMAIYGVNLGVNQPVHALAWDPSGKYLAIGCGGLSTGKGALQIYQFNAEQPYNANSFIQKSVVDFGGNKAYVKALAWSPSGTYLAVGGYPGDTGGNELSLYTLADGTSVNPVQASTIDFSVGGENSYIAALAWDPEEKFLLAGGYNFQVDRARPNKIQQIALYTFENKVLAPKRGGLIRYSNNPDGYVSTLSWAPSRQYVVIGGYKPKAYSFVGGNNFVQQDDSKAKELWLMEFLTK